MAFCLFFRQLMAIGVLSTFWPLWVMLLWTFTDTFLCGLVTLSTGQFFVVGAALCTVGCLEASLASIHQMPAVLKPPGCDNQKSLHCSPGGCITLVKNYCTKTVPWQFPKLVSQVEIPGDPLREITFCGQPSLGRHTVHLPCFCPWKFMGYFSIFKVPRVSPTAATNYGTLCNSTFVKLTWPKNPLLIFTEHPWQQLWATLLRHLLPSDHTGLLTAFLNTLCTFRPQKLCSYHVSSVAGTVPNSHSPPTCSLKEPQFCLGGNVSNLRGQILISQSQMCRSSFSLPTTGTGVDTWPVLAREL